MPGCPKFGVSLAPRNIFSHYSHAYTQQHVDALASLTSAGVAERRAGFSSQAAPPPAAASRAPRPKKAKAESAEADDGAEGEESTSREPTEAEEQAAP